MTSILLEGGPHLAGAFFDAGEIDEVRLFLAPLLLGGRTARDPLEGEGVEQISEALRALTLDCEQVADDLLISARLQGVVTCSPGWSRTSATVAAVDATRRRRARCAITRAGRRAAARATGRRQRRLPDRDRPRAAARFGADVMNETLRRSSLGELDAGRAGQPRARHCAPRLAPRRPHHAGPRRRRRRRRGHRARTASPGVVTIDGGPGLLRYVVEKGSIAVDGVSLTVAASTTRRSTCP